MERSFRFSGDPQMYSTPTNTIQSPILPPAPKVFTVPNGENISNSSSNKLDLKELEELEAIRKQNIENKKRISPSARERIEFLVGLSRTKREVTFEGVLFTLQTLKAGEMKQALSIGASQPSTAEAMMEIRNCTLAFALEKIDNQLLGLILGEDTLKIRLELIQDMEEELVSFLHQEYNKMLMEVKKKFEIKNEEDQKEVTEEIKK